MPDPNILGALIAADSSIRLQAALAAGTYPDPEFVGTLVERSAVEPDFFVRDMLTWALVRHPSELTLPLLLAELQSDVPQARSQALHTLSKIGDPSGWRAITDEMLRDPHDEVARSAWRAAVILVPPGSEETLAQKLATQLARGERDIRLSLSRALVGLGVHSESVLAEVARTGSTEQRIHAVATQRLAENPDEGFDASIFEAEWLVTLADARAAEAAVEVEGAKPEATSEEEGEAGTEPGGVENPADDTTPSSDDASESPGG